jgi:hypothetical protein
MKDLTADQLDQIVIDELKQIMIRYEFKDAPGDNLLYYAVSNVLDYYMPKWEYNEFLQTLKGK